MKLFQAPVSFVTLVFTSLAVANPFPRDSLRDLGFGFLMDRSCASYCGSDNQYCCTSDQVCTTLDGDIATCTEGSGGSGGYGYLTTTWTETHTYTSTYSSWYSAVTSAAATGSSGADCVPPEGSGEIACGPICCASWQYCSDKTKGQCMPNAGYSGAWSYGTTTATVGTVYTTQYSAPYRVTSGTTITTTAVGTGSTTTTGTAESATATTTSSGNGTAVTTTSGNHLSGGAIAGIVIGTIAGVILLLLLCACCIIRGAWHTLLGIFGLGKRDRSKERVEVIEERYSRHGSVAAGRPAHRTWFGGGGGRPATVTSRREKRKDSGIGWLAAAGAATLVLLGLRRDDKRRAASRPPRSDWSNSYYTDTYTATTPSSASSGGRTHHSRRSGQSRGTRASRHTSRHTRRS